MAVAPQPSSTQDHAWPTLRHGFSSNVLSTCLTEPHGAGPWEGSGKQCFAEGSVATPGL